LTDARNTQQAEFEAEGLQQGCASHAEKSMLELLATSSQPCRNLWATARNLTI
jgi:hypothetical protein